ncbi:PAS domain S-box protein [Ideonella margarita]|uniref:histidine kinase n=1 Tax=Ideonella margarita TaxID=2984191 RepID=A0ABU9C609_9BURK
MSALWQLVWPRKLWRQLLVVASGVIVAAVLTMAVDSTHRITETARQEGRGWAQNLALSVADNVAADLAHKDVHGLHQRLSDLASLQGVLRIDLADRDGQIMHTYVHGDSGRVLITDRSQERMRPSLGEAQTDENGTVEATAPVGGAQAWLRVRFDSRVTTKHLDALRDQAVIWMVIGGIVVIALMAIFTAQALQPLHRVVMFARRLPGQFGLQMPANSGGSAEVDELVDALNEASAAMVRQLDATRAAEARTAAVINAAPDALLGLDDQARITLVNHAVTSVFGCTEEQIIGQPVSRLLPSLTAEKIEEATLAGLFMRASGSHLARLDIDASRNDGTPFPAEVSISRVETDAGTRYAAVVRDLTEQRMTMGMMELYNRALECATNGIVISDMSLPGQPVFYANPAFTRITGYQPWEVIGKKCALLQGTDHDQPEIDVMRQAIATQSSATVVLRNYRKDGTLFFNELALAPVRSADDTVRHYVGILNDVSERERSRLALAERNARLNAVFDLSPDGYAVFDSDGVLVFGNRALRKITGWDVERVASGMTLREFDLLFGALCDPTKPCEPLSTLNANAQGAGSFDTDELIEMVLPERRTVTRLARLNIDGRGESILYFRDVTREMEVDRMKSEFLTTAAHELRTPMVSVFGFTELLLNRPVPEARRRDVLETIHRQASLLINMVNELLDLARIEARQGKDMRREPHTVAELVDRSIDGLMVQGDARKVEVQVSHGAQPLLIDLDKTIQALTNVLSNAYKYSPAGGSITLCTLDGELHGAPAVGIEVADSGIGMTPEQLARVFERFYRADPSGNIPGTGLGMSVVKEIVELQGGAVRLHSAFGSGTRVTLWLPCVAQAQPTPQLLEHGG